MLGAVARKHKPSAKTQARVDALITSPNNAPYKIYIRVLHQSLRNYLSQFERWFSDYEFLKLSQLLLSQEEMDWPDETYGCIDLDVASLHGDALNVHGLTLSKFIGNDSLDIQSSLHVIEIVGLQPMASR